MQHKGKINFYIFLLLVLLYSCKEPDEVSLQQIRGEKLGVNIFNIPGLIPGTKDSINLLAHTVEEISVKTSGITANLLGSIVDPIFGNTTASINTQVLLSSTNVSFGTIVSEDSLVLTLAYSGYYGDTTTIQNLEVFELTSDLSLTKGYYSYYDNSKNDSITYNNSTVIGEKLNFKPSPKDSVKVKVNGIATNFAPHIRINMTRDFMQRIIGGSSNMTDNTTFLSFLKGLYITATPINGGGTGAIMYINPNSAITGMTLYYNSGNTYSFIINNSSCAMFNTYNHDYSSSNAILKGQISNTRDTLSGNQTLFLQSMGGVKVKILFPGLMKLLYNGNISINKAELIISANTNNSSYIPTSIFPAPTQLIVLRLNSSGQSVLPTDYSRGGFDYFGGTYNSVTKQYKFRLTFYLQDLLGGKITGDKCLYLVTDGSSANAQRLVIDGIKSTESSRNLVLQLTYTKLGKTK